MAARPLVDPVLVVYLFAPLGGPGASDAFDHLRTVWDACRARLGMDQAIGAIGAPDTLPDNLTGLSATTGLPPTGRVLSAQAGRDAQAGRGEALLRLHHEVLSLTVRLGPPAGARGWRELDERWSTQTGPWPPETITAVPVGGQKADPAEWADPSIGAPDAALLGSARAYLGLMDDTDGQPVAADAATARALLTSLPADIGDDWVTRGAATRSGYAVWELADCPEGRQRRRIVVIGPRSRENGLSAWAWSRGTAEMTPLGYYLLQAAKIRYLNRLWDDGRRVRATRAVLDGITGSLARLLAEAPRATAADAAAAQVDERADPANDLRRRSRAAAAVLVTQSAEIGDLAQAVDIATSNLAEARKAEVPVDPSAGLFGDDVAMARLFAQSLADEHSYVERSLTRSRATAELAAADGPPSPERPPPRPPAPRPGSSTPPSVPRRLEDSARQDLLKALARAVYRPESAVELLEAVGLNRSLQAQIGPSGALAAWTTNLDELENGRVADPHRRLVKAALERYPYNEDFRAAARHLGLPVADL
ncbi:MULTISPECIES: CATRA conflict system CASPASE/TPR repeat-associated protein [Pseudofrankia]|uniref:CATRA conflict system CASPASE/TPR repeat-associated protein n=1 Tax=Pseudofrankia TaxID=2994363 RepID=UPI0002E82DD6|nr:MULTISPECIES: CATRA conflict system CASPASE/TPR repeat-associated protein [Pseudofrankia]OHV32299.1 hypothetical protein BCD49_30515 [Pseudofrankia sp. EUN1h]